MTDAERIVELEGRVGQLERKLSKQAQAVGILVYHIETALRGARVPITSETQAELAAAIEAFR